VRHGEVSINVAMMSCDRACQWLLAMAVLEEWSNFVQPDAISITAGLQVRDFQVCHGVSENGIHHDSSTSQRGNLNGDTDD